jgi:hypothetical protein
MTWREILILPLADPIGAVILGGAGLLIWWMLRVIKRRREEDSQSRL